MPIAKKHEHWCPNNCGRRYNCRAFAVCGGKSGPTDEPCWRCQEKAKQREHKEEGK